MNIGILADFEDWRKQQRRSDLIKMYREMYETLPDNAGELIEKEVSKLKSVLAMGDDDYTLKDICYLAWRSKQKDNPELTLEGVAESITMENMADEMKSLFPQDVISTKKKTSRHPRR